MHIQTITMDPEQAREKFREYRKELHTGAHSSAEREYQAAAKAYAALGKGRKLVNLRDVMRAAPVDAKGRPRLALARADIMGEVQLRWNNGSEQLWYDTLHVNAPDRGARGVGLQRDRRIVVQMGRAPLGLGQYSTLQGWAMVPLVPPAQKGNRNLRNYLVLWEVETWANQSTRPLPDRDPLLLRHLAGELYVVVAAWDLTEVERAIMGERIQ